MKLEEQVNLISRFLHFTTEPFDDWDWDGQDLRILSNDIIEKYTYEDLKEIVFKN
jgi:hypothetical protein